MEKFDLFIICKLLIVKFHCQSSMTFEWIFTLWYNFIWLSKQVLMIYVLIEVILYINQILREKLRLPISKIRIMNDCYPGIPDIVNHLLMDYWKLPGELDYEIYLPKSTTDSISAPTAMVNGRVYLKSKNQEIIVMKDGIYEKKIKIEIKDRDYYIDDIACGIPNVAGRYIIAVLVCITNPHETRHMITILDNHGNTLYEWDIGDEYFMRMEKVASTRIFVGRNDVVYIYTRRPSERFQAFSTDGRALFLIPEYSNFFVGGMLNNGDLYLYNYILDQKTGLYHHSIKLYDDKGCKETIILKNHEKIFGSRTQIKMSPDGKKIYVMSDYDVVEIDNDPEQKIKKFCSLEPTKKEFDRYEKPYQMLPEKDAVYFVNYVDGFMAKYWG